MQLDEWIAQLKGGMCISETSLKRLCYHIKNLLIEEANVQPVHAPVTVSAEPQQQQQQRQQQHYEHHLLLALRPIREWIN